MHLTRTSVYALTSVFLIAKRKGDAPVSGRTLAVEGNMPERFLLQVLRSLVLRGVLTSTRGVEGGYRLARDAKDISALDIIEAIDGPVDFHATKPIGSNTSPNADPDLADVTEVLHKTLDHVNDVVRRQLGAVSVSRVLRKSREKVA